MRRRPLLPMALTIVVLLPLECLNPLRSVSALAPWESVSIPSPDLARQPLLLQDKWNGGRLRIRVEGVNPLPSDWHVKLLYGDDAQLDIDPASAQGRIIGLPSSERVVLDVPILGGRRLRALVSPADLMVRVIAASYPSRVNSDQMIDQGKIDLFDAQVGPQEIAVGPAFGRIDLLGTLGELIGTCTGFRVAVGYWLTAAHCVIRDPEDPGRPVIAHFKIQPFDYSDRLEASSPLNAVPIASGQTNGDIDPSRELQDGDLDYAILQASEDVGGGPTFSLRAKTEINPGVQLQLFQHWAGAFGPAAGKARCADDNCVKNQPIGSDPSDPKLCPGAIQHGCSSEPGASGGPLVLRGSPQEVVGLHYRGGLVNVFNCGLPATKIVSHLCHVKPTIAKRITSCD